MIQNRHILALDIGKVRTGVAVADTNVRIALPYDTIAMNEETFRSEVTELIVRHSCDTIVVGYPRNQSGEPTAQTLYVEEMVRLLGNIDATIVFQDESLTSVTAKERLNPELKKEHKGKIDAEAAAIILQDYLEQYT
jgi:putative transcription antitermination factor YqgF